MKAVRTGQLRDSHCVLLPVWHRRLLLPEHSVYPSRPPSEYKAKMCSTGLSSSGMDKRRLKAGLRGFPL